MAMYEERIEFVLARSIVLLKHYRTTLKGDETINQNEYVACGGKRKKITADYNLKRQAVYCERALRNFVKGKMPIIETGPGQSVKKKLEEIVVLKIQSL